MQTHETHECKTWEEYFQPMFDGEKRFEGRKDDRNYQVGDYMRLREWSVSDKEYTGREITVEITYKLSGGQFGIEDGWCVLSVTPVLSDPKAEFVQMIDDFKGHVSRVDSATKLTQKQPDSQLSRARKVLGSLERSLEMLCDYRWANFNNDETELK